MTALRRVVAFLLLPALGYLLGATIFFAFWDKFEVGDPGKDAYVAVAKACERKGPVTYKGFGYWHECTADVTRRADGVTRTMTAGFLEPEHIGRQVAVNTTRRHQEVVPVDRPYAGVGGVLLFPFGILWLFAFAYIGGPVLPTRRRGRKTPIRYQKPGGSS